MSKDSKKNKIHTWHQYMNYKFLFNLNYSYRAKTEAVFQNKKEYIFDFFMADDQKFEQFYLFPNLWRETLLMHHFLEDRRVVNVLSFGQLPNKVIYREIEELRGINLSDYIQSHLQTQEALEFDAKLAEASRNKYIIKEDSQESRENHAEPTSPPTLESPSAPVPNGFGARARKTLFTEFETIEIAI